MIYLLETRKNLWPLVITKIMRKILRKKTTKNKKTQFWKQEIIILLIYITLET